MNNLQPFTQSRRDKAKEAYQELGRNITVTSDNRAKVRSYLHGLGLTAEQTGTFPLSKLQDIYNARDFTGYGVTASEADELITRMIHIDTLVNDNSEAIPEAKEEPKQEPKKAPDNSEAETKLKELMALLTPQTAPLDEKRIIELIKTHGEKPLTIAIEKPNSEPVTLPGMVHYKTPEIIKVLQAGLNVFLVGPAGSGKTTTLETIGKAFDLPTYCNGALLSKFDVMGFIDGAGKYHETPFYKAYKNGGVYLFDEYDRSSIEAQLSLNMALENGGCDFPEGYVKRHKDFYCIAAGNTYGSGADRVYVGANQMDGAQRERFIFLDFPYDEDIENAITPNKDWLKRVRKYRANAEKIKARIIISPRASKHGAALIASGFTMEQAEEMVIWKGENPETVRKIKAA